MSNNAVSKEIPICLELVGEPAGVKESVLIAGNAKMQQPKAPPNTAKCLKGGGGNSGGHLG